MLGLALWGNFLSAFDLRLPPDPYFLKQLSFLPMMETFSALDLPKRKTITLSPGGRIPEDYLNGIRSFALHRVAGTTLFAPSAFGTNRWHAIVEHFYCREKYGPKLALVRVDVTQDDGSNRRYEHVCASDD